MFPRSPTRLAIDEDYSLFEHGTTLPRKISVQPEIRAVQILLWCRLNPILSDAFGARWLQVTHFSENKEQVELEDFDLLRVLGKGSFGKVSRRALVALTKRLSCNDFVIMFSVISCSVLQYWVGLFAGGNCTGPAPTWRGNWSAVRSSQHGKNSHDRRGERYHGRQGERCEAT